MAGDPTHKTWFLSKYVVIRTPMAMAVAYLLSFHACIFRKSDNKERMKKHLRVIFIQGPCRRHRILQACLMMHAFVACLHKWLNNDATRANNTAGRPAISLLPGPKLPGLGLPAPKLLPRLVGLLDDLAGHFRVQPLLVESESVQRLIVRCLVPPEPFPDAVPDGRGYIVDVVVFLGEFVVGRDDDDL